MENDVTNFILRNSKYSQVVPFIKENAPDFLISEEYKKFSLPDEDLPGVFTASYIVFVVDFILRSSPSDNRKIKSYIDVFSQLAKWDESEIETMLRDEVFSHIASSKQVELVIYPMMGNELRRYYKRWKAN